MTTTTSPTPTDPDDETGEEWPSLSEIVEDAMRWRYVRDHLARMHSPHMGGNHSWGFHSFRHRGSTFTEAVDGAIRELETETPSDA